MMSAGLSVQRPAVQTQPMSILSCGSSGVLQRCSLRVSPGALNLEVQSHKIARQQSSAIPFEAPVTTATLAWTLRMIRLLGFFASLTYVACSSIHIEITDINTIPSIARITDALFAAWYSSGSRSRIADQTYWSDI
jgi:hypothetical protein